MGSMCRRLVRGLAGGSALLFAVGVAGCGASPYTDVSDPSMTVDFKVPAGWHQISGSALRHDLKEGPGSPGSAWQVAYEAGANPNASDTLSFDVDQPFVFAEFGELTSAASATLTYDALRDFFLPVTAKARSDEASGSPFTGFERIRDEVLTQGNGVHGVRETYDYTLGDQSDTFDEIALTDADHTVVYFIVVHCTTSCYSKDQTAISDVMSSFVVSSFPHFMP